MSSSLFFPGSIERRKYSFKHYGVVLKNGKGYTRYPVIDIVENSTDIPVCHTGLERYIVINSISCSEATLKKRTICLVEFLNYLLHETTATRFSDITIDLIKNFLIFEKEDRKYGADYWLDLRKTVFLFLECVFKHNPGLEYSIDISEFINEKLVCVDGFFKKVRVREYKVGGVSVPRKNKIKNRYLPYELLDAFMLMMKQYCPSLVLAVAFQSYAGLRESEIVNLTQKSVKINYSSFSSVTDIKINLTKDAPFSEKHSKKTGLGTIKRYRVQRVYDDFIDNVERLYELHLGILEKNGRTRKPDAPLFFNSQGGVLSVHSYCHSIRKVFYKYFIPFLKNKFEEKGCYADIAPYIDIWEIEYPGAHMFRHWFTMYLFTKAYNGNERLSAEEIMKWRGDSSTESVKAYIHENSDLISIYRESVFSSQKNIVDVVLNNNMENNEVE